MFDLLRTLPQSTAVASGYYAVRLLRHGYTVPVEEFDVDKAINDLPSEPSAEEKRLSFELLREIAQDAGISVDAGAVFSDLTDTQATMYRKKLADAILALSKPKDAAERRRGRALLHDLRQEYGPRSNSH